MAYSGELKTIVHAIYSEEIDCTVVWQYMFLEKERQGSTEPEHIPVQQTILGWYHGEPDEKSTEHFSNSTLIADYIWRDDK